MNEVQPLYLKGEGVGGRNLPLGRNFFWKEIGHSFGLRPCAVCGAALGASLAGPRPGMRPAAAQMLPAGPARLSVPRWASTHW